MSDVPELNSLSRFRKQASRLVLEAQGSCEVPAGCGGVVLPGEIRSMQCRSRSTLYTPVPTTCFIDGAESRLGRIDLAPGRHAVAFTLENVDLSRGLIQFAAIHTSSKAEPKSQPCTEPPVEVLTANDGTWKCTLAEPPTDDWRRIAFDDRDWLVLTEAESPQLERAAAGYYQCKACEDVGEICLGLPGPAIKRTSAWWARWRPRQQPAAVHDWPSPNT